MVAIIQIVFDAVTADSQEYQVEWPVTQQAIVLLDDSDDQRASMYLSSRNRRGVYNRTSTNTRYRVAVVAAVPPCLQ